MRRGATVIRRLAWTGGMVCGVVWLSAAVGGCGNVGPAAGDAAQGGGVDGAGQGDAATGDPGAADTGEAVQDGAAGDAATGDAGGAVPDGAGGDAGAADTSEAVQDGAAGDAGGDVTGDVASGGTDDGTSDAAVLCGPGAEAACDDGDPCTVDACDPADGSCTHGPDAAAVGAPCDDGDACTSDETCQADGSCGGGSATDCEDDDPCTLDTCDPATGLCENAVDVGAGCDDGDLCTVDATCQPDGSCAPGTPKDCADANPCTHDLCAPDTGHCDHPIAVGAPCEDGLLCTVGETCQADGLCGGGGPMDCDDGNPCTIDSCDSTTGACLNAVDVGASCTAGDPCEVNKSCQADGTCGGGGLKDCNDGNPCTLDLCDAAGVCLHIAQSGAGCDDGDSCTVGEVCQADGSCGGAVPLDCDDGDDCTQDSCSAGTCQHASFSCYDGNPCTLDVCHPDTMTCTHPIAVGQACDDGLICTIDEACQADGSCGGGQANPCDDGDLCTNDVCYSSSSWFHSKGCHHYTVSCDDGDSCTADSCDPTDGSCVNTLLAEGTACNDGEPCTTGETCQADGSCTGGGPTDCDDGDLCTVDSCLDGTGCQHGATVCDDGDPCTADSCDPGSGACQFVPMAAGTACDDGDLCTVNETCDASGACGGGSPVVCDDGDPCTDDLCDPTTGGCAIADKPIGAACDDGDACTVDETCDAGGICGGGSPAPPSCGSAVCGTDGCGNDCGSCVVGDVCSGGECYPPCGTITYEGCCTGTGDMRWCDSNGALHDVSCAANPTCGWDSSLGYVCGEQATEDPDATYPYLCPGETCGDTCTGKQCGYVCGASCGTCAAGEYCDDAGQCQPCSCGTKECGTDQCGNSCGTCAAGEACMTNGQCVYDVCQDPDGQGTFGCCDDGNYFYCGANGVSGSICSAPCGWDASATSYACGGSGADPSGQHPMQCGP